MEAIPFIYSMVTALKLSGSFLFLGFRRVCTMFCFVLFGEEGHSVTALLKLKIATNIQALDEFEGV